jgi:hypothetical protein
MPIKVRFIGICTHLKTMGSKTHRVVLVRADNGAFLNGAPIPPHIPKLRIDPAHVTGIEGFPYGLDPMGEAGLWQIRGVTFTLEGAIGARVDRDRSFERVPRLATDTGRPAPSKEVMQLEQAACYFELGSGTIYAADAANGAINTEAIVETGDAPALVVTCFWNRMQSRIRLTPDAVINIEHTGHQRGDTDNDYLLHFRVLESVPADAKIPHGPTGPRIAPPGDISIGCSNSQYP